MWSDRKEEKQGQEGSGILKPPGETVGRAQGGGHGQEAALHTSGLKCQVHVQGEMVSKQLEAGLQVQRGVQGKRLSRVGGQGRGEEEGT